MAKHDMMKHSDIKCLVVPYDATKQYRALYVGSCYVTLKSVYYTSVTSAMVCYAVPYYIMVCYVILNSIQTYPL